MQCSLFFSSRGQFVTNAAIKQKPVNCRAKNESKVLPYPCLSSVNRVVSREGVGGGGGGGGGPPVFKEMHPFDLFFHKQVISFNKVKYSHKFRVQDLEYEFKQNDNISHTKVYFNQRVIYGSPAYIYLFRVSIRPTRKRCEICSKLTIKTPGRRQLRSSGVFIIIFEHISHFFPVYLLFTLSKYLFAGL